MRILDLGDGLRGYVNIRSYVNIPKSKYVCQGRSWLYLMYRRLNEIAARLCDLDGLRCPWREGITPGPGVDGIACRVAEPVLCGRLFPTIGDAIRDGSALWATWHIRARYSTERTSKPNGASVCASVGGILGMSLDGVPRPRLGPKCEHSDQRHSGEEEC